MTEKIILKGRKVVGGVAEGEALVSRKPLMGWGNANPRLGMTVEREHPLFGIPFKDKVLIFTEPRGSGGFVSYGVSRLFGQNPCAFIYRKGNNLTIFAAMIMQVPSVTDFDQDPTEVIETGDWVKVDGDNGILEITKKARA